MPTSGTLTDLLSRWEELHRRGEPVAPEELCRDCPELLPRLKQEILAVQCMSPLLGTTAQPGSQTSASEAQTVEMGASPTVPGYEILGVLGRGGIGVVYRARSVRLDRVVALKMLQTPERSGGTEHSRFRTEARVMARLDHPHIVPVYDGGESQGQPYFTMKLLAGGSLAQHLPRLRADLCRALVLMEKVARGVHYLHTNKVLHRDLKPLNILLDEQDEPYVSDFGLVKVLEANLESTLPGLVLGTLPYMAPEQAAGQAHRFGPATDIWALGVILFELVTGRRPFASPDRTELASQILTAEPPSPCTLLPTLDRRLEGIILKCLHKDPGQRYGSAAALADDLAGVNATEAVPAVKGAQRLSLRRPGSKRRMRALLLVGALLAGCAGWLGYGAWKRASVPEQEAVPKSQAIPLTLIGPTGPPVLMRWIAGQNKARMSQAPDGAFSLQTPEVAILELKTEAPPGPFHLEAQIRHDDGEKGDVGLFLGLHQIRIGQQPRHAFWDVSFTDRGTFKNQLGLDLCSCPEGASRAVSKGSFSGAHRLQPPQAGGWRTLFIEQTPQDVRVSCDGKQLAHLPHSRLMEYAAMSRRGAPQMGCDYTPEGGLGLYLYRGSASFRNVILTPEP